MVQDFRMVETIHIYFIKRDINMVQDFIKYAAF